MSNTALVVYIAPKIASNYTIGCLEPLTDAPLVRRLMDRLQRGLPAGEFECHIIFHDAIIAERLTPELVGPTVRLFKGTAENRLGALGEFCRTHPHLKTIAVFHEESLFPDCRLTLEMLEAHLEKSFDATRASEFSPGLTPEIFSSHALIRLTELGLPQEMGEDLLGIMEKANQLFEDDKTMQFRVLTMPNDAFRSPRDLRKLPESLLISSELDRRAAETVLADVSKMAFDSTEAYRFKEHLLRLEAQSEFEFGFESPQDVGIPVLYSTKYFALGGAEEAFGQMILHMDRGRFWPIALMPSRNVLTDKLTRAGIPEVTALRDMEEISPFALRFMESLLKKFRIKLVHINADAGAALVMAARSAGIPIVFHVRTLKGWKKLPMLKFGLQRSLRFLTLSPKPFRRR